MRPDDALLLVKARHLSRSGEAARIRIAAGLSQSEVAATCGVAYATISRWEAATRTPRGRAAIRWARLTARLAEQVAAQQPAEQAVPALAGGP